MKPLLTLFLFVNAILTNLFSQTLPESTFKKIDSLFEKWNNINSPGCSIGIVRNDSLVFAKGYGMANLEYEQPVKPETIFHIASVSKQFTAYSIVLLAKQGRLKLDDDIRKYLSWLPLLKEKITIRNLLNHTSGIRDQWQLLTLSGTRMDDVITQDHIIKILSRQRSLNFKPGEQYSYSNSGFTILAEIVHSVTGQSLRQFTDSAIFKPLGMNNTHFHDNYTEIVKNRSYSYERIDSMHFANSILSYSNTGATSLFTNIYDMSKWIINFYNHKIGDQNDIEELTKKGKFNNGNEFDYALGIIVNTYRGWKQFSHDGGDAGYRTFVTVFPDLKMGLIVFSNIDDFNPRKKAYEIASLFIKDTAKFNKTETSYKIDSSIAFVKEILRFKNYMGNYISENGTQLIFKMKNQKIYWQTKTGTFLLRKVEKDTLYSLNGLPMKFVFSRNLEGDRIVNQYSLNTDQLFSKYETTPQSDKKLQEYTGLYYSSELDCNYGIALKNHRLVLTNNKYNDAQLILTGSNNLKCEFWWMEQLRIIRNKKKKIEGFEVNCDRVLHLRFNKIK